MRHVPVTSAPIALAIWTANGPTLPDAPSTRTLSPGRIVRPAARPQRLQREDRGVRERRGDLEGHRRPGMARKAAAGAQT